MEKEIRVEHGEVVVELKGKIYVDDAADLREQLLQNLSEGKNRFIIKMSGVHYIDSSGLGVLVAIQKRALENGGQVRLQGLSGAVKEIFELTRLTKVFEMI